MSQEEERELQQAITRLCSNPKHSMPVLPPEGWDEHQPLFSPDLGTGNRCGKYCFVCHCLGITFENFGLTA